MSQGDPIDAPSRAGSGRQRPRAAGRAAVRALVSRTAWVGHVVVHWTGTAADAGPIAAAVQRRLAGLPAGPYVVRVAAATPKSDDGRDAAQLAHLASAVTVAVPLAVTPTLLAATLRRLAEADRFPRLLPSLVGDAAAWRNRVEAGVQRARAVLDAAGDPSACLVLGGPAVPRSAHPLHWPADVFAEAERRVGAARLDRLARSVPAAADADVAAAVRGRLLVAAGDLGPFLDALPELLALHGRLAEEPARRRRAAATIQGEAVAAALGRSTVAGPVTLAAGDPSRNESASLHVVRARYQRHVTDAVGRYYAAVLPGRVDRSPAVFPRRSDPRDRVNVLGLLTDLFVARELRVGMTGADVPADRRRYLRVDTVDGRLVAVGPDGRPLRYETLAAAAAADLWAATAASAPRPLPRSVVLDAAAAGAIPLVVPWAWAEACCHAWPLGSSGLGPAVGVLLASAGVRRHGATAAALSLLDAHAGAVLARVLMNLVALGDGEARLRRRHLADEVGTLCRCLAAGLTAAEVGAFYAAGAADLLRAAADDHPAHLLPFARRMATYLAEWSATPAGSSAWSATGHWAGTWCRAFVALGAGLLDRVVRDVGGVAGPATTVNFISRLLTAMEEGPDERRPPQRAVVESALSSFIGRLATTAEKDRFEVVQQFVGAFAAADAAAAAGGDGRRLMAELCWSPQAGRLSAGFFPYLDDRERVGMAAVAMNRPDRLLALAQLGVARQPGRWVSRDDAAQAVAAWAVLGQLGPAVTATVSAAAGRDATAGRAVRALARLGLCLRFHRGGDVRAALADVAASGPADDLATLARWRSPADLPLRVRQTIDRPAAMRRELDGLLARDGSPATARRVGHLRGQLADPAAVADWVRRDLAKLTPAAVAEACVARLEATAEAAIAGHFRDVLGVAPPADLSDAARRNWDNALRLYLTVDQNRGRLRRLLAHESAGDRHWLAADPANARWLAAAAAAGVDVAAWRASFVRRVADPVVGTLRVELETDPLHVLQMGNYFGTCLSQGEFNAFSTVANATDANKRVVYAYDARGAVVGRKLLAMTSDGRVVGFRSYGTADRGDGGGDEAAAERSRASLKRVLDDVVAEFAAHCRATLHPYGCRNGRWSTEPADAELALSAAWYNDGAEPFDERLLPVSRRRRGSRGPIPANRPAPQR